jgi:hypothetical protein
VKKLVALILIGSLALIGIGNAHAAAPKAGATCSKANQKVSASGKIYTCIKKGKKLVWDSGVTATKNAGNKSVVEGWLCQPGSAPGKDAQGNTLYCTLGGDGKSSWRPQNSSPGGSTNNGNNSGSTGGPGSTGGTTQNAQSRLGAIGSSCKNAGQISYNGMTAVICKSGVVRYLLATDLPKAPAGGYRSRPDWYPTLTKILSGPDSPEPTCVPSSITFTSPVLPLDQLAPSIPYGMMVSDHVTPIDHAYLGLKSLSKSASQLTESDYVPVTAPAAGTITEVSNLGSPNSYRVVMDHGCNLYSVYMVMNRLTGVLASIATQAATSGYLRTTIKVKPGDEFGRQAETMLDFNVFDGTKWLSGFINPHAYLTGDTWKPYTADYLPFFTPAIRSAMESQLQRITAPRIGKIDYDIAGSAVGNWFLSGTNGYGGRFTSEYENANSGITGGNVPGKNYYSWSHLAVAPHQVDTNAWIFSSGWWVDARGDADQAVMQIPTGKITPDKLNASSGIVVYALSKLSYTPPAGVAPNPPGSGAPWPIGYTAASGSSMGIVALQVNADGSLSVEINTSVSDPSAFTGFTSAKRIYTR